MLALDSMVFDRAVQCSTGQMERGLFRLRLENAQHQVIFEAIELGDAVRAEGMMQEHLHMMIECIQKFERRDENLIVTDLVAYTATEVDLLRP